ncbi:hypothetical protein IFM89_031360 [Coptis chinensis]|uniref:Uncharacterized protein n=1 Tax=Coptis chinensis TaxID=261450 RepID=A0A835J340_9MAGN|nr:hypothetical protein IFM89_031360 [Coptis chinensis]
MIIRLSLQIPPQTPSSSSSSSLHPPSSKPNLNPNPKTETNNNLKGFTPLKTLSPTTPSHITNPGSDTGLLFRQKLLYLESLNINSTKVLSVNPDIRSSSLDSIKNIEKCLYSFGFEHFDIGRILDMHPILLTCDVNKDLYPVFEFLLNDVRIPFGDLRKTVNRCPRLLVCSVECQLKPTLRFLTSLGFTGANAISSQTTVLLVSNVQGTLMPKIHYLQSLGLSYREAVTMVLRSPGLLTFSIERNFRPKVDYFLNEMKGDLVELKKFPQYFSFSLEGKIKPRHRLLVERGFVLPLSEMLKVSDGEFESRLVEMRLHSVGKRLESFSLMRNTRRICGSKIVAVNNSASQI